MFLCFRECSILMSKKMTSQNKLYEFKSVPYQSPLWRIQQDVIGAVSYLYLCLWLTNTKNVCVICDVGIWSPCLRPQTNFTTLFHKDSYFLPLRALHKSIKIRTWVHIEFLTNSYITYVSYETKKFGDGVCLCLCMFVMLCVGREKTSDKICGLWWFVTVLVISICDLWQDQP